jgi:uncharacterized protein GlcG (DUF336 family)
LGSRTGASSEDDCIFPAAEVVSPSDPHPFPDGPHLSHERIDNPHQLRSEEKSMKLILSALGFFIVLTLSSVGAEQTIQKKSLTLEGAKRVVAAAVAEAKNKNAPGGAIAVVDEGGNLIAVERLDNTFAAGANISIGKARTAVLFKRPTKFFEDVINKGRTAMTTLSDFTPLQGGIPIIVDGQVIGAVGVSGAASAQQDEELAIAGANALATNSAQAK